MSIHLAEFNAAVQGFITWLAAFTNASLIYLFRPHAHQTSPLTATAEKVAHAVNATADVLHLSSPLTNGTDAFFTTRVHQAAQSHNTYNSITSVLFSALLVGLASEHAYLICRAAVRHILERAIWRGSKEEIELSKGEYEMKSTYLSAMQLEPVTIDTASVQRGLLDAASGPSAFWSRQDTAIAEIKAMQSKKEQ